MTRKWPKLGFFALLILLCGFNQGVEGGPECSSLSTAACLGSFCNANPGAKPCALNPSTNKCYCPAVSGDCKPGQGIGACTDIQCTNVENVQTACKPQSKEPLSALLRMVGTVAPSPLLCQCPLTCGNKGLGAATTGTPVAGTCPTGICPTSFSCSQGIQGVVCSCRIPKGSPCKCDEQNCVAGTICRQEINGATGQVISKCEEQIAGDPCDCKYGNCGTNTPNTDLYCRTKNPNSGPACGYCSATKPANGDPCTVSANNCASDFCDTGYTPTQCKIKAGDPCTVGVPDDCAKGYTCVTVGGSSTCIKPGSGQYCHTADDNCQSGFVCQGSGATGTCKTRVGGSCDKTATPANDLCESGSMCTGPGPSASGTGTCGIPVVDQHCYTSADICDGVLICDPYDKTCKLPKDATCDCNLDKCQHGSRCKQIITNGVVTFKCTEQIAGDPCTCVDQYCGTVPGPTSLKCLIVPTWTAPTCGSCSAGTQPNGGPCKVAFGSTHCASGYCEQNPTGPTTDGTCKVPVGGACTTGPPYYCQSGTSCTTGGLCKVPSGESCIGPPANCAGWVCEGGICKDQGFGDCSSPPDYCQAGFTCSTGPGGICKISSGGPCVGGDPTNCFSGTCTGIYCD